MNLPQRFLADLPGAASLSEEMVMEACRSIRRNRQSSLAAFSTEDIVELISLTALHWRNPQHPFRSLALDHGPTQLGFGRETLADGLDRFFESVSRQNLHTLILQDLGHPERLNRFAASAVEAASQTRSTVRGPELLVHITAGNIPNPALMSMILGLLTRSAQFVKCATGASLLPRLFAHSLAEINPQIAGCIEIAEWSRDHAHLESALLGQANCVTVTGNDETVQAVRNRLPANVRFLGYGHRLSFAFVGNAAHGNLEPIAKAAARDVAAWDQLGCLSPHLIYVAGAANQFASLLSDELAELEQTRPRGPLPPEMAALISSRRDLYQIRADHSEDTRIWCSPNSTAWTVVCESDPAFHPSCLHRFVHVKAVADLGEALRNAEPFRASVSTVGLAATPGSISQLAAQLAAWGATRICPLGQMQQPPLTWRHDGRPALADLLNWTDWEGEP